MERARVLAIVRNENVAPLTKGSPMKRSRKHVALVPAFLICVGCQASRPRAEVAPTAPVVKVPATLVDAVAADSRAPGNRARDIYRHPIETLNFFGVKPDQTVVEVEPGAGYYTEILAPLLNTGGHYVAAINPKYAGAGDWLRAHPEFGSRADIVEFKHDGSVPLIADNSADVVLTFRNCHNWIGDRSAATAFKNFFRALKPGGTLGIVDHRARAKGKLDPQNGYVREKTVIALATTAGFKLAAKSELNANPKDGTVHPKGVWTLPPSLKLGDVDRAKYLAIGESDRMTLRFTKPL